MDVEHRQPIEPCFAHATAQVSLEESQAADGALILDGCDGLCTSDLHDLPDALTTNKRSISILDVRFAFRHHRLAHRQLVLRVIVFNNKLFIYVFLRGGARAPGAPPPPKSAPALYSGSASACGFLFCGDSHGNLRR